MKKIPSLQPVNKYPLTMGKFVETRVNGGMYTTIDAADLENKYATVIENMRVRKDVTERRGGYMNTALFKNPLPSWGPLYSLNVAAIQYPNLTSRTFLFTTDGVKYLNAGAWSNLATGWAMAQTSRVQFALLKDMLVFTTNGVRTIQTLSSATPPVLADAKASKTYKYLTAFFNRIVAANFADSPSNSIKVEWCADGDVTKWEGDDRTAGSALLISGPADIDDEITGLKAINNRLFIWRKRSIWVADRQASGSAPFSFSSFINGIGCDLPYSITEVRGGIIWADTRTSSIWFFDGQNYPKRIGLPIEDTLKTDFLNLVSKDYAQGAYDALNNEWYLLVYGGTSISANGFAKLWIYNGDTEQFSYDKYITTSDYINAVFSTRTNAYSLTIGELQGTIGDLVGTIGSLGGNASQVDTIFLGGYDGAYYYDETYYCDSPGGVIQSVWQSKIFEIPTDDIAIGEVRIEYANAGGEFISFYYTTDGKEFSSTLFKQQVTEVTPGTKLFRIPLNVRCRQFQFKLKFYSNNNSIIGNRAKLLKYEVHVYQLGRSTI
jgi:hypothetical protein